MRQVEKEKKKFQSRIPFLPDPGQKIAKKFQKIQKHNSDIISIETGLGQIKKKKKKKNLVPNSVPTRHGHEYSKKKKQKNSKNKKHYSGIISIQIWKRQAEKERIKFQSRIPFLPDPGQKIPKKIEKKLKKLKNIILVLFLSKLG